MMILKYLNAFIVTTIGFANQDFVLNMYLCAVNN